MATNNEPETAAEPVAPIPSGTPAPHDRVVSLSLHADGTVAQNNPELIGDKDQVLAATQEQFRQFAVSAIDAAKREAAATGDGDTSDAGIDALKAEHEKAEAAADKAAEAVVNSLHQG